MKIGVIGLGSIGLRHAKNLIAMGHEVYGFDFKAPPAEIAGLTWGYDRPEDLDAMVIATPSDDHLTDLFQCVEDNQHILVEKPIGTELWADGKSLKAAITVAKKVVMVGNNLRFHACVKKAKEWMPKIGIPLWASFTLAQYNDKPAYLRDGVILNWGAHEVDLALYLLGEAKVRSCVVGRGGEETIADMILLHANGCQTTVHLDYLSKSEQRCFMITGTDGAIMCDLLRRTTLFLLPGDLHTAKAMFQDQGNWDDDYIEEMKAFIDRINGKETLGATGAEGLACLELLLEARRIGGVI